jgi:ketosteroid isomerase-like protein
MSQENVEFVRRIIDAWSRRDLAALVAWIHEDGEWHPALTPRRS